jgi:tRNA A-37 threonylcarbamoyl transferase component Bud32
MRGGRGLRVYLADKYLFLANEGITEPERFTNEKSTAIIDNVSNTKIRSLTVGNMKLAAKEYLPRKGLKAFKDLFRKSKPVREFLFSLKLRECGIPCPQPIAAAQRRRFRTVIYCALFAEEIQNSVSLHQLIKSSQFSQLSAENLRTLSKSLAESVAQIHNKGFFHRDLNPSHILITGIETPSPAFYYVDFENSKLLTSALSVALRARDLSRLCRSLSEAASERLKLRFLLHYAGKSGLEPRTLFEKLRAVNKKQIRKR